MYLRSSSGKGSGRKKPFSRGDDFSNYWNRDGHSEGMKVCRRDEERQANGHRTRRWDGLEKGHRSAPSSPVMLSRRTCAGDEICRLFFARRENWENGLWFCEPDIKITRALILVGSMKLEFSRTKRTQTYFCLFPKSHICTRGQGFTVINDSI